jgi:hypothetical protein
LRDAVDIRVNRKLVSDLAAKHVVHRDAQRLAGQSPERLLDRAIRGGLDFCISFSKSAVRKSATVLGLVGIHRMLPFFD